MKYLYLLSIVLLFSYSTQAQNWKTVVSGDTTYFSGGLHLSATDLVTSEVSNILKMSFVDSSTTLNGDSIFHFYNSIRTAGINQCVDSIGPTWLGSNMVRYDGGIEHYFNSVGDTIEIQTLANLTDNWEVARDSTGLVFQGMLIANGVTTVEGITDSFKRISLQAFQNGNPVANPYNYKVLEFTKNHGWLKTLDLYSFPNQIFSSDEIGTVTDTAQVTRIDNDFAHLDIQSIDLQWKYAPGNEWIRHQEGGTIQFSHPYNGASQTITHDSVIASTMLNPDAIIVDYQRKAYTIGNWQYITGTNPHWDYTTSSMTTIYTDTIWNLNTSLLVDTIKPELVHPDISTVLLADAYEFHKRYFTDTLCDRSIVKYYQLIGSHLFNNNTCWEHVNSISGGQITSSENLAGFGELKYFYASSGFTLHPQTLDAYIKRYHSYLRLGSCTYGTKIDVIALSTADVEKEYAISIYPNPANEYVIIRSSYADQEATLSLTDVNGRLLWQQTRVLQENKIDTKRLAPGLYFIRLQGKSATQVAKVVVQ